MRAVEARWKAEEEGWDGGGRFSILGYLFMDLLPPSLLKCLENSTLGANLWTLTRARRDFLLTEWGPISECVLKNTEHILQLDTMTLSFWIQILILFAMSLHGLCDIPTYPFRISSPSCVFSLLHPPVSSPPSSLIPTQLFFNHNKCLLEIKELCIT